MLLIVEFKIWKWDNFLFFWRFVMFENRNIFEIIKIVIVYYFYLCKLEKNCEKIFDWLEVVIMVIYRSVCLC